MLQGVLMVDVHVKSALKDRSRLLKLMLHEAGRRRELLINEMGCTNMVWKASLPKETTPVKCQSNYNPRDPARLLQGVLMVNVHVKTAPEDRNHVLKHVTGRRLRDRLITGRTAPGPARKWSRCKPT